MPNDASDLITSAHQARGEQRLDDAYRKYQQAAELSRTPGSEQQLILALIGLGQIERDRTRLDEAQQRYANALALCRRHASPLATACAARHLGDIYRENGLPAQAEPVLAEAIAIYRRDQDTKPLDLANAIRPLALLKTASGDVAAARLLWQEAFTLYTATNVSAGAMECSEQLVRMQGKSA